MSDGCKKADQKRKSAQNTAYKAGNRADVNKAKKMARHAKKMANHAAKLQRRAARSV